MNHYADPTANTAIHAVDREMRTLEALARKIKDGHLSPEEEKKARRRFTGIFRRLLEDA